MKVQVVIISCVSLPPTAAAATFISSSFRHSATSLHAKSTSKSKSKSSGGFGKAAPKHPPKEPFVYPPLEPEVIQTLVPPPTDVNPNGGILSEEIYDRLEAIYGLEKFNFAGENSIYRTIGVADDNETPAAPTSGSGNSLFDDLLKVDRDDSLDNLFGSPTTTTQSTEQSAALYDLNKLPPFKKFRVLHTDPMVLAVDDFLTPAECDRCIQVSLDAENNQGGKPSLNDGGRDISPLLIGKSLTVGKDSRSQAQRTSTTWFHYYESMPELMSKASRLLGLEGIERWEEPQTVR
jgi:hypothetical protein